jgi:ion channel-forming bestrophin family protein
MFLRLHGSIIPSMIMPLILVAMWTTAITSVSVFVYDGKATIEWKHLGNNQKLITAITVSVDKVLLTVLGFVVGLSLSFRSSTAYERYSEGRRYWAQLSLSTQNLARLVWIYADERPDSIKDDVLRKVSLCNLLASFAYALKHKLRFEPFTHYEDLDIRIRHVVTLAHEAERRDWREPSFLRRVGRLLGLPMADSNPRKLIKYAKQPLGNVPLEILGYCSAIIKEMFDDGTLKAPPFQTQALTLLSQMNDVLIGTDRVLNTPLPIAYSIAITQITWVYIMLLPFQLFSSLKWITIPATLFAAYIILGLSMIGAEIENPFGDDVNDLPLDLFCRHISQEIDIITSRPPPTTSDIVKREDNALLFPLHLKGYDSMLNMSIDEIRVQLKSKTNLATKTRILDTNDSAGMFFKTNSKTNSQTTLH